jgi:aminoglycoside phosphotransferase (APT) family kinase protein
VIGDVSSASATEPSMGVQKFAADDVVATRAEAAGNVRPPLLIIEPLTEFLDAHGMGAGPLRLTRIGEGASNVTCLVERDGLRAVLRRPPRGPLPPSAHDVLREVTVLRGLAGRARVPRVLTVCADEAVLGAPFYVMEHVAGEVLTTEIPAELDNEAQRRALGNELLDTLAEIHAVDWVAAGLEGYGKPTGYLERQVRRFSGLWEHNATREVPAVQRVAQWLGAQLPESGPGTVVHGDFRLGNAMAAPDAPGRIVAVFDWEMSTIGDPLADLGYLCEMWCDPADDGPRPLELSPVTRRPGFPRREELGELYAERTGRSIANLRWYRVLAAWKAAVFMEGNYRRAVSGSTDDPYLAAFGENVVALADLAEALTRGA